MVLSEHQKAHGHKFLETEDFAWLTVYETDCHENREKCRVSDLVRGSRKGRETVEEDQLTEIARSEERGARSEE